jgi:hypothetical protein
MSSGFGNGLFGNTLFGGGSPGPPPPPPSVTVQDGIIYWALRIAGRLNNAQRGPASEEVLDAFGLLNGEIDTMQGEHLFVYVVNRNIQTLVPNQQDYQIGTGAPDFNTPRPVRIDNASLLYLDDSSQGPIELPMQIMTVEDWQKKIPLKQVLTTVSYQLYYESQYPFGIIHLFPIPQVTQEIALYLWQTITPFATIADPVSLPPMYLEYLRYNLALKINEVFPGAVMKQSAIDRAMDLKRKVKALNRPWTDVNCDPGIVSKLQGRWQWWTGDIR